MKSMQVISVGILGMLMLSPMFAAAQDSTGTTPADTQTTSATTGTEGTTVTPSSKPMLRESPTLPKRLPIRESPTKILSPRDAASGQASGRMMASGTKPLPPKLEKQMEMRDCIGGGSTTDCTTKRMEAREERQTEARERMEEKRSEILKRISHQMIVRMNAAIERYITLTDRLDSRVAKLKENGIDTSKAEANIVIARTKIAEAKVAVALAEDGITSAAASADATSTKPIDVGRSVRDALQKARIAVEAAHKALVDAISSLRANVKVEGNASTTKP